MTSRIDTVCIVGSMLMIFVLSIGLYYKFGTKPKTPQEFIYKQHSYIKITINGCSSIVHNPDCAHCLNLFD